jgi:phosphotransferase system enzyme I (PtsI)
VGLFRSEFLFLNHDENANEDTQFKAYSHAAKVMGELPVRIRTSDVGGDKIMPLMFPQGEKNPLLGWRAIRLSLALPEMFKVQLRAILRAASLGNIEIMFPLISSVEEVEAALDLLDEAKRECNQDGIPIGENIRVGVMIEVPAAAIAAGILAKKVDFFSIGTNDLIQYTLAVDRSNEKVNYLAHGSHPAVLRLIKTTIDAAHGEGIKVALCGELAGNTLYTPLLLGLGIDELSVAPTACSEIKRKIRECTLSECKMLAGRVMNCETRKEVLEILNARSSEAG